MWHNSLNGSSHNNATCLILSHPSNHHREGTKQGNVVIWDEKYTISQARLNYDNTIQKDIIRCNINHTKDAMQCKWCNGMIMM